MSWIKARRRRPVAGYAALLLGLVMVTLLYGAVAGTGGGGAQAQPPSPQSDINAGETLFNENCATCHGFGGVGHAGIAPSLIGAGAAAVDFQMSTGRMPAKEVGAENERKPTLFTAAADLRDRRLRPVARRRADDPRRPAGVHRGRGHRARRGTVQRQLRAVPQRGPVRRGADLRQGRAAADPGHRDADLRGHADRARGDARLRRRRDQPAGQARHHRLRPRDAVRAQPRRAHARPDWAPSPRAW